MCNMPRSYLGECKWFKTLGQASFGFNLNRMVYKPFWEIAQSIALQRTILLWRKGLLRLGFINIPAIGVPMMTPSPCPLWLVGLGMGENTRQDIKVKICIYRG
jgi:hypothetical protein